MGPNGSSALADVPMCGPAMRSPRTIVAESTRSKRILFFDYSAFISSPFAVAFVAGSVRLPGLSIREAESAGAVAEALVVIVSATMGLLGAEQSIAVRPWQRVSRIGFDSVRARSQRVRESALDLE